jgi:hypothetical protein
LGLQHPGQFPIDRRRQHGSSAADHTAAVGVESVIRHKLGLAEMELSFVEQWADESPRVSEAVT